MLKVVIQQWREGPAQRTTCSRSKHMVMVAALAGLLQWREQQNRQGPLGEAVRTATWLFLSSIANFSTAIDSLKLSLKQAGKTAGNSCGTSGPTVYNGPAT